jgi:coenzyme PQQ precursor peptide PqqA
MMATRTRPPEWAMVPWRLVGDRPLLPAFSGITVRWLGRFGAFGLASEKEMIMAWTTPTLVEICIGLEINGYLPAEF